MPVFNKSSWSIMSATVGKTNFWTHRASMLKKKWQILAKISVHGNVNHMLFPSCQVSTSSIDFEPNPIETLKQPHVTPKFLIRELIWFNFWADFKLETGRIGKDQICKWLTIAGLPKSIPLSTFQYFRKELKVCRKGLIILKSINPTPSNALFVRPLVLLIILKKVWRT